MYEKFSKAVLAAGLAAASLTATSPAEARNHYRHGGDGAAIAVGAGILGLAVGAAIASDRDDRYYRRDYAYPGDYYYYGYPRTYYYYDNYPRYRVYRGYPRNYYYRGWNSGRYDRGWGYRGYGGDRSWRGHRGW